MMMMTTIMLTLLCSFAAVHDDDDESEWDTEAEKHRIVCLKWTTTKNQLSYLIDTIYPRLLLIYLQIIFVSLSTKGKFYEIDHSNVPQLFNKNGVAAAAASKGGQSKKQLNSDCVHRISSIIHDDAALPISLRYISKHSGGFMHNSYIPGKQWFFCWREKEKKKFSLRAWKNSSVDGAKWNYDLFTLSDFSMLTDAPNLITIKPNQAHTLAWKRKLKISHYMWTVSNIRREENAAAFHFTSSRHIMKWASKVIQQIHERLLNLKFLGGE